MQNRLSRYDITRWATDFLHALQSVKREQTSLEARFLSQDAQRRMVRAFAQATRRLLFLDYDGTLVPFAAQPKLAVPDAELLKLLERLTGRFDTHVVLLSGRDRKSLQTWFEKIPAVLVAEHGVWLRDHGREWTLLKPAPSDWKKQILPVVERFADRLPGSRVEEKEFGVAFHYRESDPEQAVIRVQELSDHLLHLTGNMDLQVLQGSKVVEIRNAGVNKGAAAIYFLGRHDYDFIFAAGDDWTDEDLFGSIPFSAYSVKVGFTSSRARYNVRDHTEVRLLLNEFVRTE
jgi:trehalose 6-phosphate synthase/phosphatase